MGYNRREAADEYNNMAKALFTNIISRSLIYKNYSEVSATGDYLNIEYYLISTLLLSLFFLGLPICAKISSDRLSGILDRGGFYLNSFGYASSKLLSGSLFLLLPASVTVIFILVVTKSFGLFSGNVFVLIITIVISCLYFAIVMLMIGTYAKSTTASIWIGFSSALVLSMVSGIFIPRNLMPSGIVYISEITGLPAIIRLYGVSLFGVRNTNMFLDILKPVLVGIIAFGASYLKIRKRLIK